VCAVRRFIFRSINCLADKPLILRALFRLRSLLRFSKRLTDPALRATTRRRFAPASLDGAAATLVKSVVSFISSSAFHSHSLVLTLSEDRQVSEGNYTRDVQVFTRDLVM
jgi:hypothetical protein